MNGGQTADSILASKSRRDNVYNLLQDGEWHNTVEINSLAVGGSEGTRRLRELRKRVTRFTIEKRKTQGSTTWEYRLIFTGLDTQ